MTPAHSSHFFISLKKTFLFPCCLFLLIIYLVLQPSFFPVLTPQKIENQQDLRNPSALSSYLILENVTLYPTGYNCVKNSTVTGEYFYLLSQDNCYFVLLEPGHLSSSQTSVTLSHLYLKKVAENSVYRTMLDSFSDDIQWSNTQLSNHTPGWYFMENKKEYWCTVIIALFLLMVALWICFPMIKQISSYLKLLKHKNSAQHQ